MSTERLLFVLVVFGVVLILILILYEFLDGGHVFLIFLIKVVLTVSVFLVLVGFFFILFRIRQRIEQIVIVERRISAAQSF